MNLKYLITGLLIISTVFALSVDIDNQFETVQEGQVASYDVTVSNTGNPTNVLITTDSELSVAVTEPLFHLETDEAKSIKILAITNGLGEGVYVIEFDVNGQEYKIGLNVEEESPVLSFESVYDDLTISQGEYQDLKFIIRNEGKERLRNIVIEGNLPQSFAAEYPEPLDLGGETTQEIKVRIHVPKDYPTDNYEYTIKAGSGNQIGEAEVFIEVEGGSTIKDRLDVDVLLPWESIKEEGTTVGYEVTFRVRNRGIADINDVEWVIEGMPENWEVEGNEVFSVNGYDTMDLVFKVVPSSFSEQEVNISFVKDGEVITTEKLTFAGHKIGFSGTGLVIGGGSAIWGIIIVVIIAFALMYVRNMNQESDEQEEVETRKYLKDLVNKASKKKKK